MTKIVKQQKYDTPKLEVFGSIGNITQAAGRSGNVDLFFVGSQPLTNPTTGDPLTTGSGDIWVPGG